MKCWVEVGGQGEGVGGGSVGCWFSGDGVW